MQFDIELIRAVYGSFSEKVKRARAAKGAPLTLAEKILYAHLFFLDPSSARPFRRGRKDCGGGFPPRPGRHAGRYGPNGSAAIHERRPRPFGGSRLGPLRPPDSGRPGRIGRPAGGQRVESRGVRLPSQRGEPLRTRISGARERALRPPRSCSKFSGFPGRHGGSGPIGTRRMPEDWA